MKTVVFTFAMILFIGSTGFAADPLSGDYTGVPEVPATAPVVTAPAESDTADHVEKDHVKKARKANFGALVSAEAHRLKAEGLNGSTKMGGWVSDQRRQSASKKETGDKVVGSSDKTVGNGRNK